MKPCPFCGAKDEHDNLQYADGAGFILVGIVVECQKCGCQGPVAPGSKKAAELWDKRTE
jgi:Lar family restriction alleviation protein